MAQKCSIESTQQQPSEPLRRRHPPTHSTHKKEQSREVLEHPTPNKQVIRRSGPIYIRVRFSRLLLATTECRREAREKRFAKRHQQHREEKSRPTTVANYLFALRFRLRFRDVFDDFFSVTFEYTHGWIECREGKRFIAFVVTHLSSNLCSATCRGIGFVISRRSSMGMNHGNGTEWGGGLMGAPAESL